MRPLISGEIEVKGAERGERRVPALIEHLLCAGHFTYLFYSVVISLEGQYHHFYFACRETEAPSYGNLPN